MYSLESGEVWEVLEGGTVREMWCNSVSIKNMILKIVPNADVWAGKMAQQFCQRT